jgi:hypothetical protein
MVRPSAPAAPAWGLVPSPNPGTARNDLRGGWAAGTNDIWAAGFAAGASGIEQTLILHNTGGGWTAVPSPNGSGGDNYLFGISGSAANDIWAVGYMLSPDGYQPLTLHWDGSTWSVVPAALAGASTYYLYGVDARAANDAWAVGTMDSAPLIEHWDGTGWSVVAGLASGPGPNVLRAVSADAANDAWAVGALPDSGQALLYHWDGTSWTGGPNTMAYALNGVDAQAPNDVWVVGGGFPYGVFTSALHWDGTTWNTVATPNLGNYSILRAINVLAANDVWAMGVYNVNDTGLRPLVLHWDGSDWKVTPGDIAGLEHNDFYGLAAISTTDVWAVGHYRTLSTPAGRQTLVEHYCPTCAPAPGTPTPVPFDTPTRTPSPTLTPTCVPASTNVPSPNHPGGAYNVLNKVSGSATNDMWAVGDYYDGRHYQGVTLHWDGTSWTEVPTPVQGILYSVIALAPNDAWSVGWYVQHWDGTSWTIVPAPGLVYNDVAAAAPNDVWAVGTGIAHWDGTAWSRVPNPAVGELNALTIAAPDDIWAVGFYDTGELDPRRTLIEHWDGTNWGIVPSPNVGSGDNLLIDVTAVSASDIWAGGNGGIGFTSELLEHWDGSSWTLRSGPALGGLNSLMALAANDIWATGSNRVAHWDGTQWTVTPAQIDTTLNNVFALTTSDVWAVGRFGNHDIGTFNFTEHFTGGCVPLPTATPSPTPTVTATPDCTLNWNIAASPNLGTGSNRLGSLAVIAHDDIWAVGNLSEVTAHWDGSQWTVVPGSGAPAAELTAVAAVSTNDVWAVGDSYVGVHQTLIEHWDGSSWTRVPSPNVNGSGVNTLFGITARTATDIWAVGYTTPPPTSRAQTLILHWDGQVWSIVASPNVGTGSNYLRAISARAADDVWAAGFYQSVGSQTGSVLVEHWDGTAWTVSPTPLFNNQDAELHEIAGVAPNNAWAVGYVYPQTLILHWDGLVWQQVPAPSPPNLASLTGLTVVAPDNVWAVGGSNPAQPIIEHWDGVSWTLEASPVIRGNLAQIGAAGATELWAVGNYFDGTYSQPLVEHYTGPCTTPTPAMTATPSPTATPTGTPSRTRTPAPAASASPTPPPVTTPTPTACAITFADVPPTDPFYSFVRCLACRGLLSGYPCGGPGEPCLPGSAPYFRPTNTTTRGQAAKILSNAAGYADPIPSAQQTFQDVPPGSTFWVFIERLAERGIVGGYPCGGPTEPCVSPGNRPYFRPNATVTRGQLAKMDGLAAGWTETPTTQTFADSPPGSPFYLYIERAARRGVVSGYPCGGPSEPCQPPTNRPYFRPGNPVTRAQAAKIVANSFFPNCSTPIQR